MVGWLVGCCVGAGVRIVFFTMRPTLHKPSRTKIPSQGLKHDTHGGWEIGVYTCILHMSHFLTPHGSTIPPKMPSLPSHPEHSTLPALLDRFHGLVVQPPHLHQDVVEDVLPRRVFAEQVAGSPTARVQRTTEGSRAGMDKEIRVYDGAWRVGWYRFAPMVGAVTGAGTRDGGWG